MKFGVGQSVARVEDKRFVTGTISAPKAVVGAVCDALDIRHVDMPITPQKIFDILHKRQAGTEAE